MRDDPGVNLGSIEAGIGRAITAARDRSPIADHLWRAGERFANVLGGRLAAVISYYSFFAAFSLGVLLYSLVGRLLAVTDAGAVSAVNDYLQANLPWIAPTARGIGGGGVTVLASLSTFDGTLLRAAASLGAPPWLAFRRVLLPRIWPGVAAGAVFAFATSLDEFIITLFLAGPAQFTLPRQMYANVREYMTPTILAAASLLFLASFALLLLTEALRKR